MYHGEIVEKFSLDLNNPIDKSFQELCSFLGNIFKAEQTLSRVQIIFSDSVLNGEDFTELRRIPFSKHDAKGYGLIFAGTAYGLKFTQSAICAYAVHKLHYKTYLESFDDLNVEELMSILPKDSDWVFLAGNYCEVLRGCEDEVYPCPMSNPISFPVYCQTTLLRKLSTCGIKSTGLSSVMHIYDSDDELVKTEVEPGFNDNFW